MWAHRGRPGTWPFIIYARYLTDRKNHLTLATPPWTESRPRHPKILPSALENYLARLRVRVQLGCRTQRAIFEDD